MLKLHKIVFVVILNILNNFFDSRGFKIVLILHHYLIVWKKEFYFSLFWCFSQRCVQVFLHIKGKLSHTLILSQKSISFSRNPISRPSLKCIVFQMCRMYRIPMTGRKWNLITQYLHSSGSIISLQATLTIHRLRLFKTVPTLQHQDTFCITVCR